MAIFVRDKHKRILVCWARRNIRQTLERSQKESRGWVLYFSFVFVFCICISLGLVSPDKGMGVLGWHTPTHQPFSKRCPTCVSNNARQCLRLKNQDLFGLRGLFYYVFITTLSLCSNGYCQFGAGVRRLQGWFVAFTLNITKNVALFALQCDFLYDIFQFLKMRLFNDVSKYYKTLCNRCI